MFKYLIIFCYVSSLFSQKTFISYYDPKKENKKEVFETDKKGIKNGNYRYYNEAGEVKREGTYKFGKKYGAFTEYTKFANSAKMQPQYKELYVDDVRQGLAISYNYDADIGVYESKKGNYKNDKEEGVWTQITPFSKIFTPMDYENCKVIAAFKNSLGVKSISTFSSGVEIVPEGKQEVYYYPSGKLYHSYTLLNGKPTGKDIYLYPDGKAWSTTIFDTNNKYLSSESYYYNGKLKQKEIMEPYFYEGYNEDGSQNKVMGVKMNESTARKLNAEKLNAIVAEAKVMASEGKSLQAMTHLENGIKQYLEWKQNTFNYGAVTPEELQTAQEVLEKIKQPKK